MSAVVEQVIEKREMSEQEIREEVNRLSTDIFENTAQLAYLLKAGIKKNQNFINTVKLPFLKSFVERLLLFADGKLTKELIWDSSGAAGYLARINKVEDQQKILKNGVDLAVGNGDHIKVKKENLAGLSREQRQQLFEKDGLKLKVRDLSQQRLWIEAQKQKKDIAPPPPPTRKYTIIGDNKIRFDRGCELTTAEIIKILAEVQND